MPAVHSKKMQSLDQLPVDVQILFIMKKYKNSYIPLQGASKKHISFEGQRAISNFKMEIMSLGLPKQVAERLHAEMMK